LSEDKKNFPNAKLAIGTAYEKNMAIKVLKKEATNSVCTLFRIKKLVGIGLVTQSFYTYGPEEQEDEDTDEVYAAIWSGGDAGGIANKEQQQGDGDEDIKEGQQPVDEEQQNGDKEQLKGDDEDDDMEVDDEENNEDTT
jgi:hypothetical protein